MATPERHARRLDDRLIGPIDLEHTERLTEISTRLVRSDDPDEFMDRLLEAEVAFLGSDAGSIHLVDEDREELSLLAHVGLDARTAAHCARVPVSSRGPLGEPFRHRERALFSDLEAADLEPLEREALRWSGIRALQVTPLVSRAGVPLGLISTHWRRIRVLSRQELLILDLLARQAADLLEHARVERRLHEALRAKDEFLDLVSHELRTPLTIILGMSRVMARGRLGADAMRALAEDITDSAERLSGSVEAMLLITALKEGEPDDREPVLLHHVAEEVVGQQRRREGDHGIELRMDGQQAVVLGQRELLKRVLSNLVENAMKYSSPRRPILVSVRRDDPETMAVRVFDAGSGLPESELHRVFEPFYRTAEGTWMAPGVGLGLAMCKRVVEDLDGTIWARRRPKGGMEFGFSLPVHEEADES